MDASERLKVSRGGHLPDGVVQEYVQRRYTSIESICETFVETGLRLCLLAPTGELLSTVLVSKSPTVALVVDSERINVPTSEIGLPDFRHQIFNFTTAYDRRRFGFGRQLIEWLLTNPARLSLCGIGVWTYVEPPDFYLYQRLEFTHVRKHDMYLVLPGTDNTAYNRRFFPPDIPQPDVPQDRKLKCFFMVREWSEQ